MKVFVKKIKESLHWCPMKVGETGEVLSYECDKSRLYVKGKNFGANVYLHEVVVISGNFYAFCEDRRADIYDKCKVKNERRCKFCLYDDGDLVMGNNYPC